MEKIKDFSFGIIPILNRADGEFLFLILKNRKGGNWGFPKGHPEENENELETARRELFEESGIKAVRLIDGLVYSEKYDSVRNGVSVDKTVMFYAGFVDDDTVLIQEEEILDFKWVTYEEAMKILVYENPKIILSKLMEDLKTVSVKI